MKKQITKITSKFVDLVKVVAGNFQESIFHIIFLAALFSILGFYVPRAYFTWFDQTVYYSIKVPVEVEMETYKSGDIISVEIERNALVDTQGISIRELILVDSNGNHEVFRYNTNLAINAGQEKVKIDWLLPPNIKDGVYFFQGVVKYPVRDITKFTSFYTEKFTVKN